MIANRTKSLGDTPEERRPVMVNVTQPAVYRFRRVDHGRPMNTSESLMPEAYSEQGNIRLEEYAAADAEILFVDRAAGARRDHDIIEVEVIEYLPGDLIVVNNQGFLVGNLGYHLVQIEGVRVVIIDNKRPHCHPRPAEAGDVSHGSIHGLHDARGEESGAARLYKSDIAQRATCFLNCGSDFLRATLEGNAAIALRHRVPDSAVGDRGVVRGVRDLQPCGHPRARRLIGRSSL